MSLLPGSDSSSITIPCDEVGSTSRSSVSTQEVTLQNTVVEPRAPERIEGKGCSGTKNLGIRL